MPVSDYTPTILQVASMLNERTNDTVGNKVGTFNDNTRPTAAAVNELIAMAAGTVSSVVGVDISEKTWSMARSVVSLRAAMLIEVSYFPEQIKNDLSPYDAYRRMYEADLKALEIAVAQAGSDGDDDEPGSADDMPGVEAAYPADEGGLIGWGTAW